MYTPGDLAHLVVVVLGQESSIGCPRKMKGRDFREVRDKWKEALAI